MLPHLIIILLLVAIVASLFSGLYFMLRDRSRSTRNLRALTIRISLSLLLIVLLVAAYLAGLIQPNAVHP